MFFIYKCADFSYLVLIWHTYLLNLTREIILHIYVFHLNSS
jgi:hypothetical protein